MYVGDESDKESDRAVAAREMGRQQVSPDDPAAVRVRQGGDSQRQENEEEEEEEERE